MQNYNLLQTALDIKSKDIEAIKNKIENIKNKIANKEQSKKDNIEKIKQLRQDEGESVQYYKQVDKNINTIREIQQLKKEMQRETDRLSMMSRRTNKHPHPTYTKNTHFSEFLHLEL